MDRNDIQQLVAYDRWANRRILRAIAALTPEQFTRDLKSSFPSVRDTVVHILRGEWLWLEYWKAPAPSPALLTVLKDRSAELFDPQKFANTAAVQARWDELEVEHADFAAAVTNAALSRLLP